MDSQSKERECVANRKWENEREGWRLDTNVKS